MSLNPIAVSQTKPRVQWSLKARAGQFHVWHTGHMEYMVTDGREGDAIARRTNLSEAFKVATAALYMAKGSK